MFETNLFHNRAKRSNNMKKFCFFFVFLAFVTGCHKTEYPTDPLPTKEHIAKEYLRSAYMDIYYYWYKEVKSRNALLDPDKYSIEDFFDEMLYQKDRWSWMCDGDYYRSMQTGVYSGIWGVTFGQPLDYYGDYAIHIMYIYPGSPFEEFGVTRGARLDFIGGYDVTPPITQAKLDIYNREKAKDTNSFTFHLTDGSDVTFTASRAKSLSTRSVLCADVITPEDYPGLTANVGYMNYLSFNKNMLTDISGAMSFFRENGIRDLILDMRYNSGGDVEACSSLMSFIAPQSAQGQPFLRIVHNDILSRYDSSTDIPVNKSSLQLDNIYIITGPATASSSEIVINGLIPYMGDKVHCVGQQTYGKPNGMYPLLYPGSDSDYEKYNSGDFSGLEYAFLPIAMYDTNSLGAQIPDEGFLPDKYWPDDLYHRFGPGEGCVDACLYHLTTGAFPDLPSPTKSSSVESSVRIPLPEDSPDYGLSIHEVPDGLRRLNN